MPFQTPEKYKDVKTVLNIKATNIYGRYAVPLPTERGFNYIRSISVNISSGNYTDTLKIPTDELRYSMKTSLTSSKIVCLNFTIHAVNESGTIIDSRGLTSTSDPNAYPNYWVTDSNGGIDNLRIKGPDSYGVIYNLDQFLKKHGQNSKVKQFIITFEPVAFKNAQTGYSIRELTLHFAYHGESYNLFEYNKSGVVNRDNLPRISSLNISDRIKAGALWQDVAPELQPENSASLFVHKEGQVAKEFPAVLRRPTAGHGWGAIDDSFIEGVAEIPPNTLEAGEITFYFGGKSKYRDVADRPARHRQKIYRLVDTRPTITSLEPDSVAQNIDNPITISWSSAGQETFTLDANGTVFSGGAEKSIVIPANTFRKGTNTIKLALRNSTAELAERIKTVTFTGYGKPSAPVFDSQTIYNTARPTFAWTCDEQVSYAIAILKGSQIVKTTGEVTTSEKTYTVDTNLQNNTEYTIKLKVKNDRGLWSDEVTKNITISFGGTLKPATLSIFASNRGAVTINVSNPTNAAFDYCEIFRKTKHETKWRRIASKVPREVAINDSLLASNTEYEYKVVSYDKQGGSVESEIKTAKIEVPEIEFIDLDSMQDINRGYGLEADAPFKTQRVRDKKLLKFEGLTAPVVEIGETDYRVLSFALAFKNYADYKAFEEAADKAAVLLFRSPQGHLIYGQVTGWGDESIEAVGHVTVGFTFTEIAFIQSEIYNAGKVLRVIRLDAGYKLDGEYHEN